jgi:translation initiation factor 3 subunit D
MTVNENALDPPGDEVEVAANSADALIKEATLMNLNFSQQVLERDAESVHKFEHPNPFAQPDEKAAPVGYLYRQFELSEDEKLVVRAETDAYKVKNNALSFMLVKALNEYDLRITNSWRTKLETQRVLHIIILYSFV